jgi:murein DD-endopeptidase MepM/ murein hydrolase activator NlpD
LVSPLPVTGDLTPTVLRTAAVRGSSASLVTPAIHVVADETFVVVRDGQTLWAIAQRYGSTVEALQAANDLGPYDLIQVGQRLMIPGRSTTKPGTTAPVPQPGRQVAVVVSDGETLWDLARTYGVSVDAIVEVNALPNGDLVRSGQRLVIPGDAADIPRRVTSKRAQAVSIAQNFVWPARGLLTSRFGWRRRQHHNGIDIAAPAGTPMYAAKAGRVLYAGWFYAYGLAVILLHGDGVSTIYGHASKLLVRTGDVVEAGHLIGLVGSTGDATGPHLHFEIRVNGRPLNPLKYL